MRFLIFSLIEGIRSQNETVVKMYTMFFSLATDSSIPA